MSADVSSQLPGPGMDRAPGDPGATSSDVPQASTAALQDARRAAINLMEDALEARGRAEQLNRELLREIAEREQAEAALKKSESGLAAAQRIGRIGSWEWNIQTGELSWSAELYTIYGLDPGTYRPTMESFAGFVHPDDIERVNNVVSQVLSDGQRVNFDFRIVAADGSVRVLNTTGDITAFDDDGKPLVMLGVNQDITLQREAEKNIRESEERFRLALKDAPVSVAMQDRDLRYVWAYNQRTAQPQEVVGKTDFDLFPEEAGHLTALKRKVLETETEAYEQLWVTRLGEPMFLALHLEPLRDERGRVSGIGIASIDMTHMKRAEDALRVSEERFRLALANAPVSVAAQDRDLRFLWAYNQRTVEPSAVVGKTDTEVFDPEDAAVLLALKRKVLETEAEAHEQLWMARDGKPMFLDLYLEPTRDEAGRVTGIGIATVDLTPMKQVEEALRESERRFSLIFEKVALPIALTRHDDGTLAEVNEQWVKTFGYSREEAIGKTTVELGFNRDMESRERVIAELRRAGTIRDWEIRAHTKSGETRVVTQNIDLVDIEGTRFALTTVYDLTERKRAEEETRRLLADVQTERERLARLIDGISDEVWFADIGGRFTLANPAAQRRLGMQEAGALGLEELSQRLDVFRPDMSSCADEEGPLLRALAGEDVRDHEEIVRMPGGEELRHRLVNASPVRDSTGVVIGAVGIVRDITQEKRAAAEREELLFQEQELAEELAATNEELRVQADELAAQSEELQVHIAELAALHSRLEQDYRFSQALIHANESVSSTLDIDEILRRIVMEGASALGADTAMLEVREHDSWTVREVFGLPESLRGEALEQNEAPLALLVSLSGEPVIVDDAALDGRVGSVAVSRHRLRSALVVPLVVRGEVVGAGVFTHTTEAGHFREEHLDFARSLAASAALALENARLYTELRLASEQQELEARLNGSLSDLAALSTARLEEEHILRAMVQEAMDAVHADSATLLKAEANGWKVHYDAGNADLRGVSELEGPRPADVEHVMTEKLPVVVTRDALESESSGPETTIVIPFSAGREVEWLLELGYRETPRLTRAHLDWARKLSFTISLALQNAKLYQDQRALSLHLQQALLSPPQKVRGVSLGHAYESATANVEVGGDFYDFFSLSRGRVAIVIGDVSGKGVDAAILASLVKNGLRAYLAEEENVATAVAKANRLFIRDSPMASFATLFCGILDPESGDLRYLLAGHPPGVVRRRKDGEIVWLVVTSPVIGMFEDAVYREEELHLAVGDLLLLYTDGIMEARQDSSMFGEEGIAGFVRESYTLPTRDMPAKLLQAVLSYTGGQLADDAAILSIRRTRAPLAEGTGDARPAAGRRSQGTAAGSPT